MTRRAWFVAAALCAALPALAGTSPNDQAAKRWKQADACVADANRQVPDHNAAAQRKRDQLANDCMAAHKLPPLTPTAPADSSPPATPKAE